MQKAAVEQSAAVFLWFARDKAPEDRNCFRQHGNIGDSGYIGDVGGDSGDAAGCAGGAGCTTGSAVIVGTVGVFGIRRIETAQWSDKVAG